MIYQKLTLIVRTQKKEMLKEKKLKNIAKHGIGIDNMDLEAAKKLGIVVTNAQKANIESVAELVVSFIMSCARNIPTAFWYGKEGIKKLAPDKLTGRIVNEDALYKALKDGKIKAAALDVFETESPRKDSPLFTLRNFAGVLI